MYIKAIQTRKIEAGDSLTTLIEMVPALPNATIVAITSKVISLCQGRLIAKNLVNKYDLISREAEHIYTNKLNPHHLYLTMKDGLLLPSAGIDESNAGDYYILHPQQVQEVAAQICQLLRHKNGHQQIGVIITDSVIAPKRQGVTGISLGWAGFEPVYDYIGKMDLLANPMKVTKINLIDALASSAVLMMGEADECTPIAIIEHAPKISFTSPSPQSREAALIAIEDDLYAPLYN